MTYETEQVRDIINRCKTGDESGFRELYDLYAAGVYRLCCSLLLNEQDAEDIAQDAFIYAFKNIQRFDDEKASFKTWLFTIAVSRCRNTYRRKHIPTLDLTQILHLAIPAPAHELPEASMARRSASDAIERALIGLSPRLREAVVLRYGHGLTYREMADVIGCPQKTAESRVRLAHKKLQQLLQPGGRALLEELLRV